MTSTSAGSAGTGAGDRLASGTDRVNIARCFGFPAMAIKAAAVGSRHLPVTLSGGHPGRRGLAGAGGSTRFRRPAATFHSAHDGTQTPSPTPTPVAGAPRPPLPHRERLRGRLPPGGDG